MILKRRASLKMCKISVDDLFAEVVEQVDRIESDKNDPLVPQSMITDYTRQFKEHFIRGEILLKECRSC